ncbi:metallophosphoesterase family protein [Niallia sp. Krafla_26]|uniref:metallophosphoesterase family protein n=1 Tax=Niallia sp. Krafla_26 TaxID=3064703 RepID=UPI003D177F2D
MSFSFIHAADIHLDSPLTGLQRYEGAPVEQIRNATREAFIHLVETAIEKKVAFVIIAGDLYDGDWKDYNTGLFFINQMVRLQKEEIQVFLIRGNHDAANVITKELKLPDNVIEFSTKEPESFVLDDLGVAIHGQGFATKSVEENLVKNYPSKIEGYINIGILHTSATGREGHENYAPCTIDDMKEKGYDYWALGHIHLREILHESNPVILFPGNIQGRHIKETGDKGCTIVEVKDGQIYQFEHQSLDVLRWELCEVDANGIQRMEELMSHIEESLQQKIDEAEGRFLALRILIKGSTKLHQELIVNKEQIMNEIRSLSLQVGSGEIWIEKIKILTTRQINLTELLSQNTPVATILEYIQQSESDEDLWQELSSQFNDIGRSLPTELKKGEDGIDLSNPSFLKKHIKDVEDLILYYLSETEVEAL